MCVLWNNWPLFRAKWTVSDILSLFVFFADVVIEAKNAVRHIWVFCMVKKMVLIVMDGCHGIWFFIILKIDVHFSVKFTIKCN